MSEFGKGYKWSQAAVKGLLLALITIVCNTITYIFHGSTIVSLLAFIVRTVASIWLLVTFMKQYAATTGENPMGFALCTVLLSSLVCAFYDAAAIAWLFPSLMGQIDEAMTQSLSMMPAEGQGIMERMMDHYPRIAFFSTFIKDFIFGLIVAAIANSSTRKKDIFGDEGKQEEDELA
ncbi:MAG: DUF4199 domain-containing protein [Bacteroidales bacterium]|nr:DUF4199 domain-containing protein [Bacteroidales bacterium]